MPQDMIQYVDDVDDARHALFIGSIVVCAVVLLAAIVTMLLRKRCGSIMVGFLLVIVMAAGIVMLVLYISLGLVAGDGCASLNVYTAQLRVWP